MSDLSGRTCRKWGVLPMTVPSNCPARPLIRKQTRSFVVGSLGPIRASASVSLSASRSSLVCCTRSDSCWICSSRSCNLASKESSPGRLLMQWGSDQIFLFQLRTTPSMLESTRAAYRMTGNKLSLLKKTANDTVIGQARQSVRSV